MRNHEKARSRLQAIQERAVNPSQGILIYWENPPLTLKHPAGWQVDKAFFNPEGI